MNPLISFHLKSNLIFDWTDQNSKPNKHKKKTPTPMKFQIPNSINASDSPGQVWSSGIRRRTVHCSRNKPCFDTDTVLFHLQELA